METTVAAIPVPETPCIMCAQYRGRVQYHGGYHEYRGGYHEYREGIS